MKLNRDEMISEISMRRDIPIEEVEEVLDEEDIIFMEYERKRRRKKRIVKFCTVIIFLAGAVAALLFLDAREKISLEQLQSMIKENVAKYVDKIKNDERA